MSTKIHKIQQVSYLMVIDQKQERMSITGSSQHGPGGPSHYSLAGKRNKMYQDGKKEIKLF